MTRELAALLNFVVWGTGYLYLRERTVLGWSLLGGYLLIHWFWVIEFGVIQAVSSVDTLVVFAGHVLLSAGLAADVYIE